jgi:hypothetical protein
MGPGPLIAIDVIVLYTFFGPGVLFAVFVVFDVISWKNGPGPGTPRTQKDPALWSVQDIDAFLGQA